MKKYVFYNLCIFLALSFNFLNLYATLMPYIDDINNTDITIRFETDKITNLWFSWGEYPRCDRYLTPLPERKRHNVRIFGLKEDKLYCYNVFLPVENSTYVYLASSSSFHSFYNELISSFSFVVIGNTAFNSEWENIVLSTTIINLTDPLFVLHTGNMLGYNKDVEKADLFYGLWNLVKSRPIFNVLGPYEYGNYRDKKEGYLFLKKYYLSNRRLYKDGNYPYYYYFDVSTARFIFLDNNNLNDINASPSFKKNTKQWIWLEEVLNYSKNKKWIFLVLNHPFYPDGSLDENSKDDFENLITKHKVDIVFQNGSEHFLRTKKIKNNNYDEKGVYYITIGGGGDVYQTYTLEDEILDYKANVNGFLYVKVSGNYIEMSYYDYNGNLINKFSYLK